MTPEGRLAFDWSLVGVLTLLICSRTYILWSKKHPFKVLVEVGLWGGYAIYVATFSLNAWVLSRTLANRGNPRNVPVLSLPPEDIVVMYKIFLAQKLLYIGGLWSVKFSFVALYFSVRSHFTKKLLFLFWLMVIFNVLTLLANVVMLLVWCRPFQSNWDLKLAEQCSPWRSMANVTIGTFTNIATDVLILTFPLFLLKSLKLQRTMFLAGAFVFCLGVFTILAALLRFALIVYQIKNRPDPLGVYTYRDWAGIAAEVEAACVLAAGCLPAFRALLAQEKARQNRNTTRGQYVFAVHQRQSLRPKRHSFGLIHQALNSETELHPVGIAVATG